MQDYRRLLFFCFGIYLIALILTNFANINYLLALNKSKENSLKNFNKFILQNKQNEKIIVFGASVVLFGMSAEQINKELLIPSINISSFGTLTSLNNILEEEILPKLTEKDLLIFSDWRWRTNAPFELNPKESFYETIQNNFEFLPNLDLIKNKILFLPVWFEKRTLNGDIFKEHYNSNLNNDPIKKISSGKIKDEYYDLAKNLLSDQLNVLKDTKAKVYMSFTPTLSETQSIESYTSYRNKFISYFDSLNNNPNITFINDDFIFIDPEIFMDNRHLNYMGRKIWTKKIIESIK
tara:strand:- start:1998 stop:2879 length:882 start_codon:yes stop_codon:yes gene_type:complete